MEKPIVDFPGDLDSGAVVGEKHRLFDMSGNVLEWCWDKMSLSSSYRVIRGGSWRTTSDHCEVSYRSNGTPGYRNTYLGFRCVFPF